MIFGGNNSENEKEVIVMTETEAELFTKILGKLDIKVTDFLELRNLKKRNKLYEKKISEQNEKILDLSKQNNNLMENLIQLNNRLSALEIKKSVDNYNDLVDEINNSDEVGE